MTAVALDGLRLTGTQTLGSILSAVNELIDKRRIALTGAGAVSLVLATHRKRLVELTDGTTTSVNVAAFAVAKADDEPVEWAEIANQTGADITVAGGAGATTIPSQAIALVESVNGTALVTVLSGGVQLAAGADGSIIVQGPGGDTRQQVSIPAGFIFSAAGNGELLRIPFTLPSEVLTVALSVNADSADFTASIDSGPSTASTDITGIVGVTANTVAFTTGTATGQNTGANGQYLVVTLANVAGTVSGAIDARYRWNGI